MTNTYLSYKLLNNHANIMVIKEPGVFKITKLHNIAKKEFLVNNKINYAKIKFIYLTSKTYNRPTPAGRLTY